MAAIDYIVFIVILIPVLFVGWFSSKRSRSIDTTKEFLLAGKGINKLQAGFSMAATDFGGSALVGAIGYCYIYGMSGAWWNLAAAPAFLLVGLFLARRLNTMGSATLPEYLGKRYSPAVKYVTCVMHVCRKRRGAGRAVHRLMYRAARPLRHRPHGLAHNKHGACRRADERRAAQRGQHGQRALYHHRAERPRRRARHAQRRGRLGLACKQAAEGFLRFDRLGFWTPMSWVLLCTLSYSTNQHYIQRMVAARDEGTATFAAVFTAGFYVVISLALGVIGTAASQLLPGIEDTNTVFPEVLVSFFPHGLLGLGLAAVFAATISTGTSILHSVATLIVNDIWRPTIGRAASDKTEVRISRALVYVTALFSLGISLLSSDIVNICYVGGLFYSVSAFLPMVFGLHGRFATARAALVSVAATVALSLAWEYIPAMRPGFLASLPSNFFGLFVSLALIVLVSLIDRKAGRSGPETPD